MLIVLSFVLGLLAIAAYAAVLVAAAWRFGRDRGTQWLLVVWLVGGLTFTLLSVAKLRLQGTSINFPPHTSLDRLAVFGSLGNGMLGAGFTTLSVRRHLRLSPDGRLRRGTIKAGIAAFFGGMLVVLFIVAMDDLKGLFRHF